VGPFLFHTPAAISHTSRRSAVEIFALHNWRNINESLHQPKDIGSRRFCMASLAVPDAQAQAARQFSFAYDNRRRRHTAVAANIFDAKAKGA